MVIRILAPGTLAILYRVHTSLVDSRTHTRTIPNLATFNSPLRLDAKCDCLEEHVPS